MSDTNNYRLEPSVGEPREPTEATDDIDDSEVMSRVPLRRPVGVGIRELPVSTHSGRWTRRHLIGSFQSTTVARRLA
jgi:hypothetical protein